MLKKLLSLLWETAQDAWIGEISLVQCMSCGEKVNFDMFPDEDACAEWFIEHTDAGCDGNYRCQHKRFFGVWKRELIVTVTPGEMLE